MKPPKDFTLEAFYYFAKQFVQYMPKSDNDCLQYKTFFVFDNESDITKGVVPLNLKKKENNYYFNRGKQDINYPALLMFCELLYSGYCKFCVMHHFLNSKPQVLLGLWHSQNPKHIVNLLP